MTAIRKTTSQVAYFQGFTNLTTDLCTSNDRFGFMFSFNMGGKLYLQDKPKGNNKEDVPTLTHPLSL